MSKFYDKIKNATIERQVEDVYNYGISFYFKEEDGSPLKFTYPYACDGFVQTRLESGKLLKLLMEYKLDFDFTNKVARAKVIIQALFYIKRFELDGVRIPNVVLIGDKNECFVFHTNDILTYLDKDVDWKIAPSSAAEKNPDLVFEIANDDNINPFVFVINENFHFKSVADKIIALTNDVQRYVHVTEHNISTIFDYFTTRVVKNASKISANDIVAIFMGIITNNDNYYTHPKKNNILVTPLGDVQVDATQLKSFLGYFNRTYTPQEKMRFSEISDRLIEDTNRRNKGEFYTPTLFVDYAHNMISEALGENWKDEYVVWDNCCGTKNLTRDYRFKELYCSTLENAELNICDKYNPEATSFQFDFLNDPLDKLPKGLLDAFEQNKPIVFFLNPPYAGASNIGDSAKKGIASTMIGDLMKKNKVGAGSQNLYIQFLYRIIMIKEKYNLTNACIGIFCPPLFLSGSSCSKFRPSLFNSFKFEDGILFNAGHFANVSASWGISFSVWKSGIQEDKNNFNYKIVDNIEGEIQTINTKNIYNIDNISSLSNFIDNVTDKTKIEFPNFTSGVKVSENSNPGNTNCCGYLINGGNNIDRSGMQCSILSGPFSNGHGKPINLNNIIQAMTVLAVRKLIEPNWINSKDEYLSPNENHPNYNKFINNSIIYSLFHTSSNQSSLREIKYHDKLWDIKNEFFWMSKGEIEELANEYNNEKCYMDVYTDKERFVYEKLKEIELSPEAEAVLEKASEIVRKTFKYRELFDLEHPEYQINNWDCGWYQIKALAKEYAKDDLEEFKVLYKAFADKMRPMIYELGFLKE